MKTNKWLKPVLAFSLIVVIGMVTYLTLSDRTDTIEDDFPPLAGFFLTPDLLDAIEVIEALEKDAKDTLDTKEIQDINNGAMSVARINRYGYLQSGLEKILWNNYAGQLPKAYKTYFDNTSDEDNKLQPMIEELSIVTDPVTGSDIDLIHMIAVIDVHYTVYSDDENQERYYDYLMGWGGDLLTFAVDVNKYAENNNLETYDDIYDYGLELLANGEIRSHFSEEDYYADIDAVNIANLMMRNIGLTEDQQKKKDKDKLDDLLLSEAMEYYYKSGMCKQRFTLFIDSFGGEDAFLEVVSGFVTMEIEADLVEDEDFVDFMKGFESFVSMMLRIKGVSGDLPEDEVAALEHVFVNKVLGHHVAEADRLEKERLALEDSDKEEDVQ